MKVFSKMSISFIFVGLLTFSLNWIIEGYFEPIAIISTLFLLVGMIGSFIAIFKKEVGSIKYISLTIIFLILLLITWFKPFQVLRILTWLKNMT